MKARKLLSWCAVFLVSLVVVVSCPPLPNTKFEWWGYWRSFWRAGSHGLQHLARLDSLASSSGETVI